MKLQFLSQLPGVRPNAVRNVSAKPGARCEGPGSLPDLPMWDLCRKNGKSAGFSRSTTALPCLYHSNIIPRSFTHPSPTIHNAINGPDR
jgi:hypothetical protein